MFNAKFIALLALLTASTGVNAHFRLLYPEPRGPFDANAQVNFCSGYANAVDNRTTFPLSGGFFSLRTNHGDWTAGVLLSTSQNPNSFTHFKVTSNDSSANPNDLPDQFVRGFASEEDAGTFCIPLDLSSTGIEGVEDGANVIDSLNLL